MPCHFLAYPYGDTDARVEAVARAVGYKAAFRSSGPDRAQMPFGFPRTSVSRFDSPIRLRLKTSPRAGVGPAARARRRLRSWFRYR
jgi:hypothetical protein